jgi:putative transposase
MGQYLLLENEEIKRHIQELLQKGHIYPSSFPCISMTVLVQKKDGTWKLYINYRSLKKITDQKLVPNPSN